LYLFSFTHSASVTDLLVYRRKSDKVAFFLKKIIVSNDWSIIQHLSPLYHARLIVGMLIDYFTCIALKIVVLEMIALIKNEQLNVYEYEILLDVTLTIARFCH